MSLLQVPMLVTAEAGAAAATAGGHPLLNLSVSRVMWGDLQLIK
jgi:hypothetical protein